MKKIIFIAFGAMSFQTMAAGMSENLSISPIIGLERVQKFQPTPRMKTRAIVGARAVYRLPITSLELEVTRAQDTSDDPVNSTSYKDVEDKARLGLRGGFALGSFVNTYLRGGAQGRRNEQTRTVNNVSTTKDTTSKVQPYVGTGIEIKFFQFFSLSADLLATYTPSDDPALKDYELQPSVGLNFRF